MGLKDWISKRYHGFKKRMHDRLSAAWTSFKEKTKEIGRKIFIFAIIISVLYLLCLLLFPFIKSYFFEFLKSHRTLNAIYGHFVYQIANWTGLGLAYLSFAGSVFFLPIPVEVPIIQYVNHHYNLFLLIFFSTIGSSLGLLFDYLLGLIAGKKILKYFFKDDYDKMKKWVDNYGGFFLFFGAILPLPIEPVCLIFGAVKYNLKKFMMLTGIGRIIKVIIIYFLLGWIISSLIPYLKSMLPAFIAHLI